MNVETERWKLHHVSGCGYYVTQKASGVTRYAAASINVKYVQYCNERQFNEYCRELFHGKA